MLPHTTKTRTTTNLKTKSNQNRQKIKLYGSLTTKELKKKHLSRPVGEAETGSCAERTCGKAAGCGAGWARQWLADLVRQWVVDWEAPHLCADKLGGTTGE